ncbi:MAG: HAD family hydrolase [Burkholderiaceae bacterium]|jgi:HAD superfamily hydrolase (TIGR01490 family)|nr:HAD family hydrolase [Burkholderiaceae bacterium]NCX35702.1 HAD family hydrolase [Actinomycetota bacterium]NCV93774.1 HAD family hydrolase [Burkholderiaceae bacterium]NCX25639.1 HAD family hydrolase [Burkholderiaceae bacterium]NCX40298.1 HAD family hydrolase [Burkholderiaceae bacterium]
MVLRTGLRPFCPVKSNERTAAFFDLDNTLISGSSFYYLVRGMVKRGLVNRRSIARFGLAHLRYAKKGEENLQLISTVTKRALNFISGRSQAMLSDVCGEIVRDFLPNRIFPLMHHRIQEHKLLGHDTWLVTAAPREIAQIVAEEMGMSGALGTRVATHEGLYTDELESLAMHGMEKSRAVRKIAEHHGYDLRKSFAYSDSINDLPLLMTVGRPITVNPNKELKRIAAKNRWPVLQAS